jgi:hypothetical protein
MCSTLLGMCMHARHGAADDGDPCATLPPAEITVSAEHAIPRIDYTHSSREIRRELGSTPYTVALGLTRSSTTLSVQLLLKAVVPAGDERLCARPQIDVVLRHSQLDVWLAREIEHDACVAAAVLEHEMTHVAIERDTLDWTAQQLQTQLLGHYAQRVLRGTDAQIKTQLVQDFEERWSPALESLLRSSTERHAAHDEQDSYGDAQACDGELYQVARRLQ